VRTERPGAPGRVQRPFATLGRLGAGLASIALLAAALLAADPCRAADNLKLAPDLSFVDDSSSAFPIEADHLGDAEVGGGRASIVFFGASHCWNTNREAERLVALYPRFRDRIRFTVVDVNRPSEAQRPLLERYYRGSIPTLVVLAADGRVLYSEAGETARQRGDTRALERLLAEAAAHDEPARHD
jgi:hypothetical protein